MLSAGPAAAASASHANGPSFSAAPPSASVFKNVLRGQSFMGAPWSVIRRNAIRFLLLQILRRLLQQRRCVARGVENHNQVTSLGDGNHASLECVAGLNGALAQIGCGFTLAALAKVFR